MVIAVMLVTALAYFRSLGNGFVYDDHEMIVTNRFIGQWSFAFRSLVNDVLWFRDPLHLPQCSFYRPLVDIWLWLNFRLCDMDPARWHAAAVALHIVVVGLVYRIARRLSADAGTALFAALLFGLMPVHAEPVVWSSSVGQPLAAAFQLAAFDFFMRRSEARARNLVFALAFYAGALLSHESAMIFPAMVWVYVWLLETPRNAEADLPARMRRGALEAAPFLVEVVLYGLVRVASLGFINQAHPMNHASAYSVMLTIPEAMTVHLALLLFPWQAGPAHRVLWIATLRDPRLLLSSAGLAGAAAIFYLLVRNSPRRRLYLFCTAWIAIALLPALNLGAVRPDQLVHDRYLYLPSVGFCIALADFSVRLARVDLLARGLVGVAAGLVLAGYAATLFAVQHAWHDDFVLFSRCVMDFPESPDWHANLGVQLNQLGDLAGAERELRRSLELAPDNPRALFALGFVHSLLGRNAEAADEMAKGLKLEPRYDPFAYAQLAQVLELNGDHAQSEAILKYAESLPEGGMAVAIARAQIKTRKGDAAGAEALLRPLSVHNPENRDFRIWQSLGIALAAQNRYLEALGAYEGAIALKPDEPMPHFLAAQALRALGRDREALDELDRVIAMRPKDIAAKMLRIVIRRRLARH